MIYLPVHTQIGEDLLLRMFWIPESPNMQAIADNILAMLEKCYIKPWAVKN